MKNFFLKLTLAVILLSASAAGTNAVENNNSHKLVADRDQVNFICPRCSSTKYELVFDEEGHGIAYRCRNCGYTKPYNEDKE